MSLYKVQVQYTRTVHVLWSFGQLLKLSQIFTCLEWCIWTTRLVGPWWSRGVVVRHAPSASVVGHPIEFERTSTIPAGVWSSTVWPDTGLFLFLGNTRNFPIPMHFKEQQTVHVPVFSLPLLMGVQFVEVQYLPIFVRPPYVWRVVAKQSILEFSLHAIALVYGLFLPLALVFSHFPFFSSTTFLPNLAEAVIFLVTRPCFPLILRIIDNLLFNLEAEIFRVSCTCFTVFPCFFLFDNLSSNLVEARDWFCKTSATKLLRYCWCFLWISSTCFVRSVLIILDIWRMDNGAALSDSSILSNLIIEDLKKTNIKAVPIKKLLLAKIDQSAALKEGI